MYEITSADFEYTLAACHAGSGVFAHDAAVYGCHPSPGHTFATLEYGPPWLP
jgi:hypothetical protein